MQLNNPWLGSACTVADSGSGFSRKLAGAANTLLEQSLKVEADCLEVSLPSISVASWSDLNAVYQENSAAALEVVNNVLNSPHNTWNYPSPGSPRLQYPPNSTLSPVVPWSPTAASSPELPYEFIIPGFPFLEPTGPGPYDLYVP